MSWAQEQNDTQSISGDRRVDRRYQIQLDLKWKLIRRRRVLENGTGFTIDFSSGGVLVETGRQLPHGLNLELSISWPVLLHNVAPLQLLIFGKIVRSQNGRVAVQMIQHEFRTIGVPPEHRGVLGGTSRAPAIMFPGSSSMAGMAKAQ